MSFWDREVRDSIDRMFDRNRDGYIDRSEEAMEFMFLDDMTKTTATDFEDDWDED